MSDIRDDFLKMLAELGEKSPEEVAQLLEKMGDVEWLPADMTVIKAISVRM